MSTFSSNLRFIANPHINGFNTHTRVRYSQHPKSMPVVLRLQSVHPSSSGPTESACLASRLRLEHCSCQAGQGGLRSPLTRTLRPWGCVERSCAVLKYGFAQAEFVIMVRQRQRGLHQLSNFVAVVVPGPRRLQKNAAAARRVGFIISWGDRARFSKSFVSSSPMSQS